MSDSENTTYRHYPIQVAPDRIIVQGPNRTRAEFTTMAAARKFIRDLIALEMTGTNDGAEPAAEFTPTPPAPVISSATTAEPCVNKADVEPAGANGTSQSGSSDLVALNYLRGME